VLDWTSPDIQRQRDVMKMHKAVENNLSVIRLLQDEVFFDKLKNNLIQREEPVIICIDSGSDIYSEHISDTCNVSEYHYALNCYVILLDNPPKKPLTLIYMFYDANNDKLAEHIEYKLMYYTSFHC